MLLLPISAAATPPFSGTIFIDPDIITSEDHSTFRKLTYTGQGLRTMFDRREGWVELNAFLFIAEYENGQQIEFQVNPEYGSMESARAEAAFYAPVIGRLPVVLLGDVQTSWIHMGDEPFGGGNNNLLIHTGSVAQGYIQDGILEETLVHEAAHTSLDALHTSAAAWLLAQQSDPDFISTYAMDFPDREDIAESFLPYIAVRYRPDRIDTELEETIRSTIPGRIDYFDSLGLDIHPLGDPEFAINAGLNDAWVNTGAALQGLFLTAFPELKLLFLAWFTFDSELPGGDASAAFGAPGQRWVTAIGSYENHRAALKAELTTGGVFNASNPVPVQNTSYGSVILEFSGCGDVVVNYDFPPAGESGAFSGERVIEDNIPLCEALEGD